MYFSYGTTIATGFSSPTAIDVSGVADKIARRLRVSTLSTT